jgi:CRP/FNR family nitrogen fixation transcriptional regulator
MLTTSHAIQSEKALATQPAAGSTKPASPEARAADAIRFAASGMLITPAAGTQAGQREANHEFLAALDDRSSIVRVEREQEIVAQDEAATYCYLVLSGCVRTAKLMEDGRRQVGEFLFAGEMFGLEALDRHDFSAEAVTPATLRRYERRDIETLADEDRDVARILRQLSAHRTRAGRDHVVLLGRKTAAERIASFLLEMCERISIEGRSAIELPMSRADMGDYLGLTIETVCRRLTRLREDGTIAIKGATIAIRDYRALGITGGGQMVH